MACIHLQPLYNGMSHVLITQFKILSKNRCHRIFGPCIQSPVKNCLQFIKFENCQYQDIQQLFFSQHFKNSTSYVKIYTS